MKSACFNLREYYLEADLVGVPEVFIRFAYHNAIETDYGSYAKLVKMKYVGLHKTRVWLRIVETYHLAIKIYSVRFEKQNIQY